MKTVMLLLILTTNVYAADFTLQLQPADNSVTSSKLETSLVNLIDKISQSISSSLGPTDADKLVKTGSDGKIDSSLLNVSSTKYSMICRKLSNSSELVAMDFVIGVNGFGTGFTKLPSGFFIGEPKANGIVMFFNNSSGISSSRRDNPIIRYENTGCLGTPYLAFPAVAYDVNNTLIRIPNTITKMGNLYFKALATTPVSTQKLFLSFRDSSGNCSANSSATVTYSFAAEEILDTDPDLSDIDVTKCSIKME